MEMFCSVIFIREILCSNDIEFDLNRMYITNLFKYKIVQCHIIKCTKPCNGLELGFSCWVKGNCKEKSYSIRDLDSLKKHVTQGL